MSRFLSCSPRLPVSEIARTIGFYVEVLGFEAAEPWPAEAPTFVLMERDAVVLQFYTPPADAPEPCGHGTISIDVEDALAMFERVRDRVTIEWGPEVYFYGRREFSFRDPDGYALILSEETDDPPTCAA